LEKYSGAYVPDYKNAVNIPANVQILVFDEYRATKCIPLEQLKSLASSNVESGYLNRKSHGASYKPPKDVQIIILSNYSPYEVYASWDKKFQRKIISDEVLTTFDTRFHTFRMDGDNAEQRRKWMSPTSWTEEEFQMELKRLRDDCLRGADDRVETAEFILTVLHLYKARTNHGKSLEHFIKSCLRDGNDIRLTRMIYQDNLKRIKDPRLDRWHREPLFGGELPPSGEDITKGLITMREDLGDQTMYDTRWLDAAIGFPKQFAKYIHERVLPERPEPTMTEENLATICIPQGRKCRHSECSANFKDGGRIICNDAAHEINVDNIDDFDLL
jgi:hypothetical protein